MSAVRNVYVEESESGFWGTVIGGLQNDIRNPRPRHALVISVMSVVVHTAL